MIELLLRNRASYVATLWLARFDENSAEARYANLKRVANAGVRTALGSDSFCGYGSALRRLSMVIKDGEIIINTRGAS